MQSFNRLVGMGSLAQCLSGSNHMAAVTSLTVSGWKLANVQPDGTDKNDGDGVLAVKCRCRPLSHRNVAGTPQHQYPRNSTTAHQCIDVSPELSRGRMLRIDLTGLECFPLPAEQSSVGTTFSCPLGVGGGTGGCRASFTFQLAETALCQLTLLVKPVISQSLATLHDSGRNKLVQNHSCFV